MSQTSWTESLQVKDLTEQIDQGFGILDSTGRIQYVNDQLAQILGYHPEDLVGILFESLQGTDDNQEIKAESVHGCDIDFTTKSGNKIKTKVTIQSLDFPGQGWYMLVTPVDDDESLMTPQFLTAFEQAAPRMMVIGPDFNIQYLNHALEEFTPQNMIGLSALLGVQEPYRKSLRNVIEAVFEEGVVRTIEIAETSVDNPTQWFVLRISPIKQENEVVSVVLSATDITARYAADETLRRDRRIFHDLAQSFIQTNDINELTTNMLTKLATNYGFDFGLFTQYIPSTNILRRTASIGKFNAPIPPDVDLSDENADSFLITHIFKTKTAVFISDIEQEVSERPYLRPIQKYGAKSVMAAPIVDDVGKVQAVVSFATTTPRIFTEADIELFSTITRMLGSVLERRNAEIQKQSAQNALERERRAFQSIANAVVNTTDANELAFNVLKGLTSALGFDLGTVRLFDEKEQVLRPTAIVGMDPSKLSSDVPCRFDEKPQHLVSLVALTKEKIIAPDILNHKSTLLFKERLEEINVKSIVVWPILDESENMVGVFTIGSHAPIEVPETSRPFFDTLSRMLHTLFERKKTEQALLISERRYRELITDISEGIGMADLNERLVFVNKPFAEILGYTPEELVGMSIIDLVHPEDIKMILENTDRRIEGKTSTYTHRFIRSDGEQRLVRVSAVPSRDGEGIIDGTIAIVTDITEQMKAEVTIRESEARFRSIFESSPVGMHLVELADDGNLRIVDTNPAADAFDRRHRNIKHFEIGQVINYEIKGTRGIEVIERYKEILRTGIPWNVEDDIVDKEGKIVGAVQLQIFRASMRTIVTSFLDITERVIAVKEIRKLNEELAKRVEERTAQLAAANKELESFAYSVSHDLRAPLRTMDGFSQALLEDYSDTLDETGKDYLSRIRTAAIRMGSLIEDILSLSRVTRTEMNRTDVNLSDIAHEVMQELTAIEPDRSVEFSIIDFAYAKCDNRLMKIAVYNLIDNALKFSKKVERAKIEFGTQQREGKTIFFVRDNGAGFDMKHKEKLFTPFQRLHPPEEFEGSGIGLATVQRVINRHGGLIWAESAVNEGTTFYFTLPD